MDRPSISVCTLILIMVQGVRRQKQFETVHPPQCDPRMWLTAHKKLTWGSSDGYWRKHKPPAQLTKTFFTAIVPFRRLPMATNSIGMQNILSAASPQMKKRFSKAAINYVSWDGKNQPFYLVICARTLTIGCVSEYYRHHFTSSCHFIFPKTIFDADISIKFRRPLH